MQNEINLGTLTYNEAIKLVAELENLLTEAENDLDSILISGGSRHEVGISWGRVWELRNRVGMIHDLIMDHLVPQEDHLHSTMAKLMAKLG